MTATGMIKDGRQVATSLDGIREDHRRRYEAAAATYDSHGLRSAADLGCGTGYGAFMLAARGFLVQAFEIDPQAVAFGEAHYSHPRLTRQVADLASFTPPQADLMTAFEIIEHVPGMPSILMGLASCAKLLFGSVPNQDLVPFDPALHRRHVRHYRPAEIASALISAGWRNVELGCQLGKRGPEAALRWDRTDGRTIVFMAEGGRSAAR